MQQNKSRYLNIFRVGTDQLWPFIILGGFMFFASLVSISPNDFWWHLKIGEIVYTQHIIPSSNLFSWSLPENYPFVYGAWLGELLLYILYHLGKLELVIFARNVLIGLTFLLISYETKRRSGSWRASAFALAFFAAMTLNNLIVRPQMWSWLICIGYFILLSRYTDRQLNKYWLLLCPILMVFWVNAHGAYILGGVILGIFFVGEVIRTFFKSSDALNWSQVRWIFFVGVLTGLAIFLNPQGVNTINYVHDLMTDQPSQNLIVEWQSPSTEGITNIAFYISILITIGTVSYSKKKLKLTELLLICSFTWLAWTGMRYIIWYGMICIPILMDQIIHLPIRFPVLKPQQNLINSVLIMVIFIPAILVQPWYVDNFPLPERYWKIVQHNNSAGPLLDWNNPIQATEYLENHPGGNLFNDMGYGSYLIWALDGQKVFIDPRVELYPFEQWEDYIRITRGARYNQILDQYGADRIFLSKDNQPELATALESDLLWSLEYEDVQAQIWIKRKP